MCVYLSLDLQIKYIQNVDEVDKYFSLNKIY